MASFSFITRFAFGPRYDNTKASSHGESHEGKTAKGMESRKEQSYRKSPREMMDKEWGLEAGVSVRIALAISNIEIAKIRSK